MARCGGCDTAIIGLEGRGSLGPPNRCLNHPDERDRRGDSPSGRGDCAPIVPTPRPRAPSDRPVTWDWASAPDDPLRGPSSPAALDASGTGRSRAGGCSDRGHGASAGAAPHTKTEIDAQVAECRYLHVMAVALETTIQGHVTGQRRGARTHSDGLGDFGRGQRSDRPAICRSCAVQPTPLSSRSPQ